MTDVHKSPPREKANIYENTKESPSKSSNANGDSARSGSSSGRSDKTGENKKKDVKNNDTDRLKNVDAETSHNDEDTTDRGKLHDVTCLSMPPLPAGAHKSQKQTNSFTAAPPNAEQMRKNSLLGSLPPLEPVAMASDLTADIKTVLGKQ